MTNKRPYFFQVRDRHDCVLSESRRRYATTTGPILNTMHKIAKQLQDVGKIEILHEDGDGRPLLGYSYVYDEKGEVSRVF